MASAADACVYDGDRLSQVVAAVPAPAVADAGILSAAMVDPVSGSWLIEPPVRALADIRARNNDAFMLAEGFENCFSCILLEDVSELSDPSETKHAVRVGFSYQGRHFQAIAYGRLPGSCDPAGAAAMIIPGSGMNQSSAIVERDPANAHFGGLDALSEVPNVYVLVKPNEDLLAWHDGNGHKLTGAMIWTYHVNRGGSYSVSYLAQSLAFVKWMKGCFGRTVVAGLSQGGAATLLNALQSRPTLAIVSSGHSVLFDQVEYAGANQLIGVPGYARLARTENLVAALRNSPTRWLFTWGRGETDVYGADAQARLTAGSVEPLDNVDAAIHDGGHVFAVNAIRQFVHRNLDR